MFRILNDLECPPDLEQNLQSPEFWLVSCLAAPALPPQRWLGPG